MKCSYFNSIGFEFFKYPFLNPRNGVSEGVAIVYIAMKTYDACIKMCLKYSCWKGLDRYNFRVNSDFIIYTWIICSA